MQPKHGIPSALWVEGGTEAGKGTPEMDGSWLRVDQYPVAQLCLLTSTWFLSCRCLQSGYPAHRTDHPLVDKNGLILLINAKAERYRWIIQVAVESRSDFNNRNAPISRASSKLSPGYTGGRQRGLVNMICLSDGRIDTFLVRFLDPV